MLGAAACISSHLPGALHVAQPAACAVPKSWVVMYLINMHITKPSRICTHPYTLGTQGACLSLTVSFAFLSRQNPCQSAWVFHEYPPTYV